MTSIWVESLGRNFEVALALLDAAIRGCTDELWESSMWRFRSGMPTRICMAPAGPRHRHWRDLTMLPTAWSPSDLLGYLQHCRQRVRDTLKDMSDQKAATLLPPAHRYRGQPYAWILTGIPGHTIEHASPIRQFITAAGIAPDH